MAALALLSMLRGDLEVVRDRLGPQRSGQRPRRRIRHAGRPLGGGDETSAAEPLGARRRHLEPGPPGHPDAPACSVPAERLREDFDIVIDNSAEPEHDWPGARRLVGRRRGRRRAHPPRGRADRPDTHRGTNGPEVAQSLGRPYGRPRRSASGPKQRCASSSGVTTREARRDRANGGCDRCRRGRAHGPPLATRLRAPGGLPGRQWPGRPAPRGRTRSAPPRRPARAAASAPLKSPAS